MSKPIATFNIHSDRPVIFGQVNGPRRWMVKIWAKGMPKDGGPEETESCELKPTQPCRLNDLLVMAGEQIEDMLDGFTALTDAGFEVYVLR